MMDRDANAIYTLVGVALFFLFVGRVGVAVRRVLRDLQPAQHAQNNSTSRTKQEVYFCRYLAYHKRAMRIHKTLNHIKPAVKHE